MLERLIDRVHEWWDKPYLEALHREITEDFVPLFQRDAERGIGIGAVGAKKQEYLQLGFSPTAVDAATTAAALIVSESLNGMEAL